MLKVVDLCWLRSIKDLKSSLYENRSLEDLEIPCNQRFGAGARSLKYLLESEPEKELFAKAEVEAGANFQNYTTDLSNFGSGYSTFFFSLVSLLISPTSYPPFPLPVRIIGALLKIMCWNRSLREIIYRNQF